jgi:hypothetical protein
MKVCKNLDNAPPNKMHQISNKKSILLIKKFPRILFQFGINNCSEHGRQLETLISEYPAFDEFCLPVCHRFPTVSF